MEQGWVKIQNNIHSDPLLNKDSEYLSVWIYLVTHSAYMGYDVIFNGKVTRLNEGQLLTSRKKIADATGVNDSKIKRILIALKNEQRIEQQTDRQQSLITLIDKNNYKYKDDRQIDQRVTNERPTEKETENEKEKRSKREKEKEKEINKNDKNVINNNPLYPPLKEEGDELFSLFWSNYPKKVGKGYAKKCFDKIKPSRELVDTMVKAINAQRKSEAWQRDKGQYIPNPSTWLNQQRWEDDLNVDLTDPLEDEIWSRIEIRV